MKPKKTSGCYRYSYFLVEIKPLIEPVKVEFVNNSASGIQPKSHDGAKLTVCQLFNYIGYSLLVVTFSVLLN